MYIRFETDLVFTGTSYKEGIFAAMGDLKRMEVMTSEEYAWYRETATWFNQTLANPKCFDEPVKEEIKHVANSWFVEQPSLFLDKSYQVAELLIKYGISVTIKRSKTPGKVIYSDSSQLVVMPEAR